MAWLSHHFTVVKHHSNSTSYFNNETLLSFYLYSLCLSLVLTAYPAFADFLVSEKYQLCKQEVVNVFLLFQLLNIQSI